VGGLSFPRSISHNSSSGALNGMGDSMPRNASSSHMKQAFATRQKTSQKRAKLRRMKELYASHLSAEGGGAGGESDGNKSASEDELLQVRALAKCVCVHGCLRGGIGARLRLSACRLHDVARNLRCARGLKIASIGEVKQPNQNP
jgi:hypothetical protein